MLSFVRKAARSWVAAVLIGLLVVSFTIWGINDVFKGNSKDNVALVAGKAITSAEFRAEFDKILKRASKDAGTVSYTHLDVYKRQQYHQPFRQFHIKQNLHRLHLKE